MRKPILSRSPSLPQTHFKRVLITGISGSGGSYLAEHRVERHPSLQVHGLSRWHSTTSARNLSRIADRVFVHECDMTDLSSLLSVVADVRPDAVFHLASHANVRASFLTPLAGQVRKVCLVHGEPDQAELLARDLRGRGFGDVTLPAPGERVLLDLLQEK